MSRRTALLSTLALGAVLAVLVAPIFFDQSLFLRDQLRYNYPEKLYLRDRFLAGDLPLWNPLAGLGRPLLGLVQPAVLYPANLLLLLPRPFGVDLYFCAHLFWAALGLALWLRARGRDPIAATVAGVLFGGSGYLVAMAAGNGAYVTSVAWVPWALWSTARSAATHAPTATARMAAAARLAIVLALCLFAGDPQALLFAVILVTAQALAGSERAQRLHALATVAAAGTIFLLLALPQLLAGGQTLAVGRPGGVSLDEAAHFALPPQRLVEWLWPGCFGAPHTPSTFLFPLYDEGTGVRWEPWASGIYLGLLVWICAPLALLRRQRDRLDLILVGVAILALLISFGKHTPIFALFFRFVPLASLFRYPEKYLFLTSLCVCALVGSGLAAIPEEPRRARSIGLVLTATLGFGALLTHLLGPAIATLLVGRFGSVSATEAGAILAGAALRSLAVAAVLLLVLSLAAHGRLRGGTLLVVLGLVGAIELAVASRALLHFAPSEIYRSAPRLVADLRALAGAGEGAPTRLYRTQDAGVMAQGGFDPVLMRLTLLPNSGLEDGIAHMDGYVIFHTQYEDALQSALRDQPLRLLQINATRFALLSDRQLGPTPPPALVVRQRYPAIGANLVELTLPAPRAYLAMETTPARDASDAAQRLRAADFVPGQSAAIEGGEARRAAGDCQITRYRAEQVVLRCTTSAPSYAVLNDVWFPGWTATVDGAARPILRANAAMRAVAIDAGTHEIVFRYRPLGLVPSLSVAALALLGCLLLLWRARASDDPGSQGRSGAAAA